MNVVELMIHCYPIEVNSCKYLGVMINSELTWMKQLHVEYVDSKLLKFTSIFTDFATKLTLLY